MAINSKIDQLFDAALPVAQQPEWPDKKALADAVATLKTFPPLVFAGE